MKVSIIIPTYNRADLLERTLYRFHIQGARDYEVILCIDDDPGPELHKTLELHKHYLELGMPIKAYLTYQFKPKSKWVIEAYPLNVAIRQSTGDLLLINGADTMSATNTIEAHREQHIIHRKKPRALFSRVWAINGGVDIDKQIKWKHKGEMRFDPAFIETQYTGHLRLKPYFFCGSVPKDVVMRVNGFDEDYIGKIGYCDDDFARKLKYAGVKFAWSGEAVALHQHHTSVMPTGGTVFNVPEISAGYKYFKDKGGRNPFFSPANWGCFPKVKDDYKISNQDSKDALFVVHALDTTGMLGNEFFGDVALNNETHNMIERDLNPYVASQHNGMKVICHCMPVLYNIGSRRHYKLDPSITPENVVYDSIYNVDGNLDSNKENVRREMELLGIKRVLFCGFHIDLCIKDWIKVFAKSFECVVAEDVSWRSAVQSGL